MVYHHGHSSFTFSRQRVLVLLILSLSVTWLGFDRYTADGCDSDILSNEFLAGLSNGRHLTDALSVLDTICDLFELCAV
jgi:hypothetical protein